jgi:Fur family ferric uptake transcriptional regulator
MSRINRWIEILQQDGCRITAPRRAIIEVLVNSPRALQPAEVYSISKVNHPGIGLVTVYRTLERLEKLGLIQRVHREDGCHMLMPAADGHEHYLICTTCGRAILFQGDDLGKLFTKVESTTGFEVSEHWLQLFGTCPDCREQTDTHNVKVENG